MIVAIVAPNGHRDGNPVTEQAVVELLQNDQWFVMINNSPCRIYFDPITKDSPCYKVETLLDGLPFEMVEAYVDHKRSTSGLRA